MLDKNLGCHFESGHEHFVITYKRAIGKPVPIYLVKNDDESFRYPNRNDIDILKQHDSSKETTQQRMKIIANHMEMARDKSRKDAKDLFRDQTKDDKIQLMNAASRLSGSGKNNSTFRRITPKPQGKVINPEPTTQS